MASSKTTPFEPPSLSFPTEFPYDLDSFGSNSGLNSPLDSLVSSTDGLTDDDDFFLGLPHQLSWASLFEKKSIRSGSPQSTLSGFDSEFTSSQLKSPPMAVLRAENDGRAILHAAAREAERLKMSCETTPYQNRDHFIKGFVGVRSSIPVKSTNHLDYGIFSNQNYAINPKIDAQIQQVREDLVVQALCASSLRRRAQVGWSPPPHRKPEICNRERNVVQVSGRCGGGTGGLSHPAWLPPLHNHQPPPNMSAVRCVLPGGSVVNRASSGTGVFLPRRRVNPADFCHKRGIPGIRFPEEIINPIQAPLNHCQSPALDSILSRRNNPVLPMPIRFRAEGAINQEFHLPQEWTY